MVNRFDKTEIVESLLVVARRAAMDTPATHPEDIANAMTNAIEYGASMLDVLNKQERLVL